MSTTGTIVDELAGILGSEHVVTDEAGRDFYSADISFEPYATARVVAQPGSTEELAAVVAAANGAGLAVVPRGGGMSYTLGYTPTQEASVQLDLRRMNRIREINTDDMYVIAEAGCTWEQLYQALSEKGVRTPYYGPLSGRFATVGGALSQNSIFWGCGQYGSLADCVLGLEVVLSGGRILRTGSWARERTNQFFRHNGPDLSGIFTADTGAFAVKAAGAIQLVPSPAVSLGASFVVSSWPAQVAALEELGRTALTSECYGLDPFYHDVMVRAGLDFLEEHDWTIHFGVDAPHEAIGNATLEHLKGIAAKHGTEIDNTVVGVFKNDPFGAAQSILLGPEGQLWLPVHAVLPWSKSQAAAAEISNWFDEIAPRLKQHGITTSLLTATAGTNFLFEPSFYWFDELGEFRLEKISPEAGAEWKSIPADEETRSVVLDLRRQMAKRLDDVGCCHLQIGKYYDYGPNLEAETWALTQGIKELVDPHNLINPGSLGL